MGGTMDFNQSMKLRCALLKDLPANSFEKIIEKLRYSEGVEKLTAFLRLHPSYVTAIVSGGFLPVAEHVRKLLGLTHCFANSLEEKEGFFTGEFTCSVDVIGKARILSELRCEYNIPADRVSTIVAF